MQNFSHTIWIGDLEPYMDEVFVRKVMEASEERPLSIKVIRNKLTGATLGYGFVEFLDPESAKNCMMRLNGKPLPGFPGKRFKLNHASYGKDSNTSSAGDYSLFVGELTDDVDDLMLYNTFKKYSSCRSAKIVSANGKSKGYGFVRFQLESDMESALLDMQNYTGLGAKPIRVSLAVQRKLATDAAGMAHCLGIKTSDKQEESSILMPTGVPDPYAAAVAAAVSGSSQAQVDYMQVYQQYYQQYYASQQYAQPSVEGGQIIAAQAGSDPNQSASLFGTFVPDLPNKEANTHGDNSALQAKLEQMQQQHVQQFQQQAMASEPYLTADVLSSACDRPRHINDLDECFPYLESSRWDALDPNLPLICNILPMF